jgi:leucyl aminopeptidase
MYREVRWQATSTSASAQAWAVALFDKTRSVPPALAQVDRACGGALASALKRTEFAAGRGALTTLYPTTGPSRLYIMGLGDPDSFTPDALRVASVQLVKAASAGRIERLRLHVTEALNGKLELDHIGRVVGEGLSIGQFVFDQFKGTARNNGKKSGDEPATLKVQSEVALGRGLRYALTVGRSVNLARQLAATPPNVANPAYLVRHCRSLSRAVGLRCRVIDHRQARRLNMGGLLAVGAGGSTPPALIVMEHKPARARNAGKPILLVGKAITFDTGGYSIKPAQGMESMKYDKCGGMAVIGAMHAIAALKLPVHVVGLVATAENMVDAAAYRPSDIITFTNGVTCEVTNTDAEGRLVLADALAYGTRSFAPAAVIDLATLTGGVVVALGSACAGCFCSNAELRSHLFDAAEHTGERLWHLPLWREHRDLMKSNHADIVNSGAAREAHPIQGAAFLSYFIEPDGKSKLPTLPWAHLDIAGVAEAKSDTPLFARGPTGYGVRLLVRAAEMWR